MHEQILLNVCGIRGNNVITFDAWSVILSKFTVIADNPVTVCGGMSYMDFLELFYDVDSHMKEQID